MTNKKNYISILILLAVFAIAGSIFIYSKGRKFQQPVVQNNQNQTKQPLIQLPNISSLTDVNLRQPLPISSSYFQNPKIYVSEDIGFAFDYEGGWLEPLQPTTKKYGIPDDEPSDSTGVLYEKNNEPGSSYYTGHLGILKFRFLPVNSKATPQGGIEDNTLYVFISHCRIDGPQDCFDKDKNLKNIEEKQRAFYNSITDISQVTGIQRQGEPGIDYEYYASSPDKQFDFVAKINTGDSVRDKLLMQMLFKALATFRLVS